MRKTSIEASPHRLPLDAQVGFLLRRAYQRAAGNLMSAFDGAPTAPQYAVLVRLDEDGPLSQNELGRRVDMEPATIHGVIGRLRMQGLIDAVPDPLDSRRRRLSLTAAGRRTLATLSPLAAGADAATLSPLTDEECRTLLALLRRIADKAPPIRPSSQGDPI